MAMIASGIAQDKIVTVKNDTIDCEITRNNTRFIYFRILKDGMSASGKISRSEVKQLILSKIQSTNQKYHHWRMTVSGGAAFRLTDTRKMTESAVATGFRREDTDHYYEQLSRGWQINAGIAYFLNRKFAAGLNYRFSQAQASSWLIQEPPLDTHNYYGKMAETTCMNYGGISLLFRQPVAQGEKFFISAAVSGGLVAYRNEASVLGSNSLFTANAPGMTAEAGLEYLLAKDLTISLSAGFFGAKIEKINRDNGQTSTETEPEAENQKQLNSLDLSAGLRFYF
ncbi:MAG: hypothetical protein AAGU19_15245 [Prolixibacteraceae bacterium]